MDESGSRRRRGRQLDIPCSLWTDSPRLPVGTDNRHDWPSHVSGGAVDVSWKRASCLDFMRWRLVFPRETPYGCGPLRRLKSEE